MELLNVTAVQCLYNNNYDDMLKIATQFRKQCSSISQIPVYDNNVPETTVGFDQFNTLTNANACWNHIYIECIPEVVSFSLCNNVNAIILCNVH